MTVSHLSPCLKPALWAHALWGIFGPSVGPPLGSQWPLLGALNGLSLGPRTWLSMGSPLGHQWASLRALNGPPFGTLNGSPSALNAPPLTLRALKLWRSFPNVEACSSRNVRITVSSASQRRAPAQNSTRACILPSSNVLSA